jgi:predicted dienelactone hydrolase
LDPPSRFGVDAPELARLGEFGVGMRTVQLTENGQADVLAFDPATGTMPQRDRALTVDIWYPGRIVPGAPRVVYSAALPSEPPAPPANFTVPGIAVRGAPAAGRDFPLIIVSHGYSGDPAAMTWITENLASKGYVVAAIHHADPPITDASKRAQPMLRRPLDIVFVAERLRDALSREHLVDPERLGLLGYSMGGYGVLTAAGATWDPDGPLAKTIPAQLLEAYARGGASQGALALKGVRAVVAISPAGGGERSVWGPAGLVGSKAPLLLIAGDRDHTVNYTTGARAFFDTIVDVDRFLLTFKGAGHDIGLCPAPDAMHGRLWDQDWFEDPVWRAERVNAIEAHFITAFFGRYVKGDPTFASYLEVRVAESSDGVWPPASLPTAYGAVSPGTGDITVWKGFQRNHAEGLELLHATP